VKAIAAALGVLRFLLCGGPVSLPEPEFRKTVRDTRAQYNPAIMRKLQKVPKKPEPAQSAAMIRTPSLAAPFSSNSRAL